MSRLIVFVLFLSLYSCEKGNIIPQGESVEVSREICECRVLLVESEITVEVSNSSYTQCIVKTLENIEPYVLVEQESDTVHIYLKPELEIDGSCLIEVFLSMSTLENFIAKDGAQIILSET